MRFLTLLILFFYSFPTFSQIDPVKWSYEVTQNEDLSYDVSLIASMEDDWVIYSQHTDPDGPIPTSFKINNQDCLKGAVVEKSQAIKVYSDLFMVDVIKFKKEAIFVQNIRPNCTHSVELSLEYMTCDGGRCLPPKEVVFDIGLD